DAGDDGGGPADGAGHARDPDPGADLQPGDLAAARVGGDGRPAGQGGGRVQGEHPRDRPAGRPPAAGRRGERPGTAAAARRRADRRRLTPLPRPRWTPPRSACWSSTTTGRSTCPPAWAPSNGRPSPVTGSRWWSWTTPRPTGPPISSASGSRGCGSSPWTATPGSPRGTTSPPATPTAGCSYCSTTTRSRTRTGS